MRSSRATKILTWLAALVVVVVLGVLTGETRRARSSSIYINEVLLLNRLTNVDEDGGSAAWVEVHNASAATVDLTGFALTNDPTIPHKWRFPTRRLPPGGHLIAWCSGKDRGGDSPVDLHTNFELTRGGETVILTAPDGSPVDAVALLPQTEDRSYGRLPDATGEFRYLLTPTPGSSNEGPASQAPMPSRPRFHPEGGAYHERLEVEVSISLPVDGYEIRYTTDGSLPDAGSLRYPGPIVLVPGERGNKILRAAAFYDDARVSQVETHSYFLDGPMPSLPVLSVAMDPAEFKSLHLGVEERGPASERRGHVEILEPTGRRALGSGIGLRLHGFTGRLGHFETKKSYRMYFRDAYGNGRLRYPLVPHEADGVDRVVLRAGNDDAFRQEHRASYVRDELIRARHALMDGLVSHGSWYSLFVNMEYRGVYNVVERIDGDFSRAHLGAETEFDIVHDGVAAEGSLDAWMRLGELVKSQDLASEADYEQAIEWIDLEGFTDYMILNIWAQNHDWPHKNYFAVRPRSDDGKFVFLSWDAEISLGLYPPGFEADTFERALVRGEALSDLFAGLMANRRYQELFIVGLEKHLSGALEPSELVARIRRLREEVAPDLEREIRESFSEAHVDQWNRNMDDLLRFVQGRPDAVRHHVYRSSRISVPRVLSATPEAITADRGARLRLVGRGFTENMRVFINDVPVEVAQREIPTSVDVLVPADARLRGSATLRVSDPVAGSTSRTGLLHISVTPSEEP